MKLHLPHALRSALIRAIVAAACCTTAYSATMHSDVSLITYTDWGQNCGRYTVGNHVNALLSSIRTAEGGIVIHYTGGQADYTMEHEMLDTSSVIDGGHGAAVGINWLPSVAHNYTLYPAFTAWKLGYDDSVHYNALNTYSGKLSGFPTFSHQAGTDYRIDRLSKIVIDVTTTNIYSDAELITENDGNGLDGVLVYRVGGGTKGLANYDGSVTDWGCAYAYTTGGIMTGDEAFYNNAGQQDFSLQFNLDTSASGVSTANPMPFACQQGDSGSPLWIYNETTHAYEYITAMQSCADMYSQSRGNVAYTQEVMTMYNVDANFGSSDSVTITSSKTIGTDESDTLRSGSDDGKDISATKWYGTITAADGTETQYVGVKQTDNGDGTTTLLNVWKNLSDKLDDEHWYAYGSEYFQASDLAWKDEENGIYSDGSDANTTLTYADLFSCSNLIFSGTADKALTVNVDEVVELGVGYVQFSLADDATSATFNLAGTGSLNSAGYVVDEGVSLHSTLTGDASYIREWRKGGAGKFCIEGTGNNKILLSVGGGGTTYLNRTNGYAAYNVLASTGETIVISDINQIYRDLTLGNDGGTLDMNGQSMTWNNDVQATESTATEGFTIHALDECAVITNNKAESTTTLTWTQTGAQTWLGSFKDSAEGGALQFIYNGGTGSTLTMHSIATDLSHQSGSGITVQSGTLALGGTLTVHGKGSVVGNDNTRLVRSNDWHYADATTPVTVQNGGTFELQSHARLTGDVTVQNGGTFIMHEGVQSRYEYVEGGETLEDTDKYSAFFGHKGNVTLESGSAMKVQFTSGTTSDLAYEGDITGTGSFTAELGSGGRLTLSGNNTFTGNKEIVSGGVLFRNAGALGSEEWKVDAQGFIVSDTFTGTCSSEDILSHISADSDGVLALNADRTEAVVQQGLYIGADAGTTVSYGSADAELAQNGNGAWLLGGGGGTLEVNFKLTGEGDLEIGNACTTGVVKLTNANNNFTGDIHLNGAVTLGFVEGALGDATLEVGYGQSVLSLADVNSMLTKHVAEGAEGVLALDETTSGANVDLSSHTSLALGAAKEATLSGDVTVGSGTSYHFSGMGLLHVQTALADGSAGATDMVVDGQGLTGGVIQLETAATLTGAVEVYGHKDLSGGSITLNLATTGALDTASGVTVKQGGTVSVAAGTTQTFKTLTIDGGEVTGNGKLIISGDSTVSGDLNVASAESRGSMNISGTNTYSLLTVSSGTLTVGNDNALSGNGYTVLGNGATLNLNGHKDIGFVGIDSNATAAVSGGTLTGSFEVATTGTASVSGLTLTNAAINETGGTIELAGQLTLCNNTSDTTQTIGGTISGGTNGADSTIYSANTTDNAGIEINTLSVGGGSVTLAQESWNTNWTIHSLEGGGTLTWAPDTTHWYSSTLVLDGENSFYGVIDADAVRDGGSSRAYQKYLVLANDKAAANAYIWIDGDSSNAVMSLAINTEHAEVKGIAGNANAVIYAGDAVAGAYNDSGEPLKSAPTSTRNAELIITGIGENTFGGTVNGADKLDLTMRGSGKQAFSGTIAVNDISAEQGTLIISGSDFTYGDISISGGATFSRGSSDTALTVASGNTLSVVSGTAGSAAALTGGLTLSGGTMVFDAVLLESLQSEGTYALSVSGTVTAESDSAIGFSSTCSLVQGKTYYLASGDWSSAATTLSLDSSLPSYLKGTLAGTADGLALSTAKADNAYIWDGTNDNHTWTSEQFGTQESVPGSDSVVAFTDTAANKEVQITATTSVGSLVFDHTGSYSVTTGEGVTLTAAGVEHNASGTTTLGSGVVLTGKVSLKAGELVLQSMDTLGSNSITAESGATLGLDIGTNSTDNLSATGLGTLHLLSGRYMTSGAAPAEHVTVDDGGQLYMHEGTAAHDVTIAGSGWADTSDSGAAGALRLEGGATISGDVTLADNSSVMVMSSYTGTLSGAVNTAGHTLTKNGGGTLVLSGSLSQSGAMVINAGTVQLTPSATTVGLSTVTVNEGGTLYVRNQVLDASSTDLILNKGTLHSQDQYGLTGPTFKSLTVNGNSTISSTWEGMLSFGSLTGSGDISINTSSGVFALNVGNLSGYSGTLNESGRSDGQLYISSADISGTVISGLKTYLRDGFEKIGDGTLQLNKENTGIGTTTLSAGTLRLNGNTTLMNFAGGDATLAVGSGATLTINGAASLDGTVIENSGSLVNNGTISGTASLNSLDAYTREGNTYRDYSGHSGENGFLSSVDYRIFSGTGSTSGLTITGMTYVSDGLYAQQQTVTATSVYQLNSADQALDVTAYLAADDVTDTNGIAVNNTGAVLTASADTTLNAAVTAAQDYTVQVADGATLSYQTAGDGAITKTGEGTLALGDGSVISSSLTRDGGTITLAEGAQVTVSAAATLNLNHSGNSNASVQLQGGTLNYESADTPYSVNNGLSATAASTLILGANVSFTESLISGGAGNITLGGEGLFDLGSESDMGVALGSDWKGTVRLAATGVTALDLDAYSRTGSSLLLNGTSGWLGMSYMTIDAALVMEDNNGTSALNISDASDNKTVTFNGSISGSGTLERTGSNTCLNTYVLKDASGWTGKFLQNATAATQTSALTISGSMSEVNFATEVQGGVLNLYTNSTADTVNFNKTVQADSFTMQGNGVNFLKAVTISGAVSGSSSLGNLSFSGEGANSIGSVDMGSNTFSVGSATQLTINGNVSVGAVIENNGSVIFNGNSLTLTGEHSTSYSESNNNGFICGQLFSGSGTVQAANLCNITLGDTTYTQAAIGANGYFRTTTYELNNGSLTYGAEGNAMQEAADILLNSGSMEMKTALSDTTKSITLGADAVLTLDTEAALSESAVVKDGHTLSLSGSGRYTLSDYTSTPSLTDTWTGTVIVPENNNTEAGFNLNNYGNTASTVELQGLYGWANFWSGGTDTYEVNICFTNPDDNTAAFDIKYISDNLGLTFNGNLSGTGTFALTAQHETGQSYTFNGDMAEWTGAFAMSSTASATLKFAQDATEINAALTNMTDTGSLAVNAAATEQQTFNGALTITGLTMTGGAVTLAGQATVSESITGSAAAGDLSIMGKTDVGTDLDMGNNTVSVGKGATLSVAGTLTAGKTIQNAGSLTLGTSLVCGAAMAYSEGANGYKNALLIANADGASLDTTALTSLTVNGTEYRTGWETDDAGLRLSYGESSESNTYYFNTDGSHDFDNKADTYVVAAGAKGTIGFSGSQTIGTGGITITSSGTVNLNITGGTLTSKLGVSSGNVTVNGTVTVAKGATYALTATDDLGWSTNYTQKVTLNGGTLDLGGTRQTQKTAIELKGNATVQNGQLDTFGGLISAENTGNEISASISARMTSEVKVAKGGELTISGNITDAASNASNRDGIINKTGDGTLKLTGSSVYLRQNLNAEAGSTIIGGGNTDTSLSMGGAVNIDKGAQVKLEANGKITGGSSYITGREGGALLTGDDAVITAASSGDIGISNATVDNALIQLAAGTTCTVTDVLLTADTRLTDDNAKLVIAGTEGLTVQVASANVTAQSTSAIAADSLYQTGTGAAVGNAAGNAISFTLNNLADVSIEGTKLHIDMSKYSGKEALKAYDYMSVTFETATFTDLSSLVVVCSYNETGQEFTGYYQEGSNAVFFATTPEPATATLSLLALAGLAARRRRR